MPVKSNAYRVVMLVLVAVLFLAVNMISNVVFRSAQIDLTQGGLFTLSDGTKNVIAAIDEPITLRFFYSEKLANDYPSVRTYAGHVRDLLEEMRDRSNGKIHLEVIDPEPFSEQEDLAVSMGLNGAPTTEGDIVYFGLVGTNMVDGLESIPFFSDKRAQYLEYDVTRMVQNLTRPKKPVLGIVTNLPLDTGAGGLTAAMRGQSQPFMIYEELRARFQIEFLEQKFATVPDDVDVLMIAHPRPLDKPTLYAIDQFVMRGGRVLAFIDPHSEVSLTAGADGQPVRGYTEASNLEPLLKDWGVAYDPLKVVGDRALAQRVQTGLDARRQESDYVLWLSVPREEMNQDDIVTTNVDHLNLGTVGALSHIDGATTRFTPLIWSSKDSALYDLDYVKSGPTPDMLLRSFKPGEGGYVIAARIAGPIKSAFDAAPALEAKKDDDPSGPDMTAAMLPAYLASTSGDANIIVFADSDIFDDRFWVQAQQYQGDRVAEPIADNAKFVLSAIDNLMGSDDLISLRAREKIDRPFKVVEALQRDAERRFLSEQANLQDKISDTEKRLKALQTSSTGQGEDDARVQAEINKFRAELVESRKALRNVQRNLRRDIDDLAGKIRFLNVIAMPLLVAVIALVLAFFRHRRRKARVARGGA
ncbi:MAG: ABC transporter [Rhizobiales bacterium]|nr:ABC transporter [Hyphomicrobiales bacterium]